MILTNPETQGGRTPLSSLSSSFVNVEYLVEEVIIKELSRKKTKKIGLNHLECIKSYIYKTGYK